MSTASIKSASICNTGRRGIGTGWCVWASRWYSGVSPNTLLHALAFS